MQLKIKIPSVSCDLQKRNSKTNVKGLFLVLTDKVDIFCLFVNSMRKTKSVPLASSSEITQL